MSAKPPIKSQYICLRVPHCLVEGGLSRSSQRNNCECNTRLRIACMGMRLVRSGRGRPDPMDRLPGHNGGNSW